MTFIILSCFTLVPLFDVDFYCNHSVQMLPKQKTGTDAITQYQKMFCTFKMVFFLLPFKFVANTEYKHLFVEYRIM